jgi:aspartyl-tRNA synthetase
MKRVFVKEAPKFLEKEIKVAGWVDKVRTHGSLMFLDLRDLSGVLQIVLDGVLAKNFASIKPEWVLSVKGEVKKRPVSMINPKNILGEIELLAKEVLIISKAKTLPFRIDTIGYEISEEKRLHYRYLDLRRPRLKKNLKARHQILNFVREFLSKRYFIEIETPLLTKSTPEGARDYLVPVRQKPGHFFALPQSPQQYKQLLQVAGFERYFQIARCFRDEDPRGDRQPEFTQLDIEMSFVSQEEILELIEELFISLVKTLYPEKKLKLTPEGRFLRMSYQEAMAKFKSDKPDLRENKNDPDELAFLFVIDFPMFEWKETEKRWDATHHPFTMPKVKDAQEFKEIFKRNPAEILAFQHDLVLNGFEVGGGSMRTFDPELLSAVFEAMGHKKTEIQKKFGHLLEAFEYGVPPHGGIAPGIDRLVMILEKEPNIREVIAFPKTGDGRDLMMAAPSLVEKEQLEELHLKIVSKKKRAK